MADFDNNMLGSDEDSNEDIDHIPKTPGPPVVSDHESDEDKSGDERDGEEVTVKTPPNDSESDSDSSSSESDSSNDHNNRNSGNDSEVERSDNENEDIEGNKVMDEDLEDRDVVEEANEDMDSDNEKNVNESQDNDSDDEIVRNISPKKNKRKFDENSDSSDEDSNDGNKRPKINDEIDTNISPKKNKRKFEENSDSSDEDSNDGNKRPKIIDDLDENEDNEDKDEEIADKSAKAKDIFGEMSSEEEDEENDTQNDKHREEDERDSDKESDNENKMRERRDAESGDEEMANNDEAVGEQPFVVEDEEQPEEPIPETRIEVEIPRIVADLGKEVHFVKLPNFLSIDTHPYDPQWYEDEIDEDENLDDEGRARLKLKVENTIRWRNTLDKDNNDLKRESNTRVVKWSDGTYSLHLGEEIFDIHKLQLVAGDNNHLFIRQGTGLQGQTVFRTKLTFRPFSTESFTHRKLTLSLADRSQKTQKIRVLPNVGKDPEAHRTEMIKKEEDRLKASIRRENKQRRVRERSLVRGPTASYLEPDGDEDDEEEGISIARIKNQYKKGSFGKHADESDISGEESKAANEEDDDDSDDLFDKNKEHKRRTAQIVESDDE